MDDDLSAVYEQLGFRPWYRRRLFIAFVLLTVFFIAFVPWVPLLYFGEVEVMRLDAKGQPISTLVGPKTKQWVEIKAVSRHLLHAIIVAEDAKFYSHFGFDFDAILHAYKLNQRKGKFVRGGSTISQQVVKMAFLSREKTYIRKAREAAGTLLMEILFSKEDILEWYINLTEFGGGIYGVKQAGQYYFRTRPELLTTEQAIHLALVIPSPNKWSKGLRAKSLTPFGHRRFMRIANNLQRVGYISTIQRETVLARGNFGSPIAGSKAAIRADLLASEIEDDDCKGDKECEDFDERPKLEKSEPSVNSDLPIEMPKPVESANPSPPSTDSIVGPSNQAEPSPEVR